MKSKCLLADITTVIDEPIDFARKLEWVKRRTEEKLKIKKQ